MATQMKCPVPFYEGHILGEVNPVIEIDKSTRIEVFRQLINLINYIMVLSYAYHICGRNNYYYIEIIRIKKGYRGISKYTY